MARKVHAKTAKVETQPPPHAPPVAPVVKPKQKSQKKQTEFSSDEILEYGKFKSQPGQKLVTEQHKAKIDDKSGEYAIEESSLDEDALKDLSSKAGLQKAYETPKVQAQNATNTTTPASKKVAVAQSDKNEDSKVGGFSIESDGLEDIDEPKPTPVAVVVAPNKTEAVSQPLHINATAIV
jgi:hypothetical protein